MSRILIGLAVVWLFASGFTPASTSACGKESPFQRDCKPCKRPDGTLNHSPNVTDLVLDKTQLRLKDPSGPPPDEPVRLPELLINVATTATDVENDVLDYYYVISGGRIVGSGSNVQWDLNGVPPGTYTITARVDDSCGVCGKTLTRSVMVIGKFPIVTAPATLPAMSAPSTAKVAAEAPVVKTSGSAPSPMRPKVTTTAAVPTPTPTPTSASVRSRTATSAPNSSIVSSPAKTSNTIPPATAGTAAPARATAVAATPIAGPCSCPKILISDPEKSDSDLTFTTKLFDLTSTNRLTYIWTVMGGTVISQDGRSIRIKPGIVGGSVSVIVNGLDPKCSCPNKAQKTF